MKKIKFLKPILCDGIIVWNKGKEYEIIEQGKTSNNTIMYKANCEDGIIRGISANLLHDVFELIEIIEEAKHEIQIDKKKELEIKPKTKTKKKK